MKTIEEWIDQNREFLDSVEPDEGHHSRFMDKLSSQNRMLGRNKYIAMRFSNVRAPSTGVSGKNRAHSPPVATSSVTGSITPTMRLKSCAK